MPFDNFGTYEIARVITMIWPLCLRQRRDVPRQYVRTDRCVRDGRKDPTRSETSIRQYECTDERIQNGCFSQ